MSARKLIAAVALSASVIAAAPTRAADKPYAAAQPAPTMDVAQFDKFIQEAHEKIAAQNGALTDTTLPKLLEGMGYEVTTKKNDHGDLYHTVVYRRDGWKFVINASISDSGQYLWLSSPLGTLSDSAAAPQPVLMKMMAKNLELAPTHFSFNPKLNRFYLDCPVANRALTARILRQTIDQFLKDIETTEPIWNQKKWTATPTTPKSPTAFTFPR